MIKISTILLVVCVIFVSQAGAQAPSFSGADGAGANATGRGGLVYHVDLLDRNYSDRREGTLRYGLDDSNFTVGGEREGHQQRRRPGGFGGPDRQRL